MSDTFPLPLEPWHIHWTTGLWPISAGRLFLAAAADQLGNAMFKDWSHEYLRWARHTNLPFIPEAGHAFTPDDLPIASVHDLYAPAVRSVLPHALREHVRLLVEAPFEEWLASMVPNPDGGEPISAPLLSYQRKEESNDPVTPEHWEAAWLHADIVREERERASRFVPEVAGRLLTMIQEEGLGTFARPFHGGESLPIDRSAWEVDSLMDRLSLCAFDPNNPFDPLAKASHWIFVDKSGFEDAIADIEAVALPDSEYLADEEGVDQAGNVVAHPSKAAALNECATWLVERFDDPRTRAMRKGELKVECLSRFAGRLSARGFETAWQNAASQRPERSKPGRRPDQS